MIYDNLDFFILEKIFFSKPSITTWEIAKTYFNKVNPNTTRELNKKHVLIKQRL